MAMPAASTVKSVFVTGPRKIEVRDVEPVEPGPGQVRIRTIATGISAGTEMNVYRGFAPQWRKKQDPATRLFVPADEPEWTYPIPYGYANVGRVEGVGEGVTRLRQGQLVFSYTAHASAVVAPEQRVVPLPELERPEHGVFLANINTALNGVLDARPPLRACVAVFGLGVIGQLVTRMLRQLGPRTLVVVDRAASRRELALAGGADHAVDPEVEPVAEAVRGLTAGRGADIAIEVSGASPALNEAIRTVGVNGTVIAMSWYGGSFENLDLSGEFHHNRVRVISSQVGAVSPDLTPLWGPERRMAEAIELLPRLDLDDLISHRIAVQEAAQAYDLIDRTAEGLMQVVLTYGAGT
jgi:2-desacetyl-2-hydroxyethyl bacteriochlorophyllide A dehydrogenase